MKQQEKYTKECWNTLQGALLVTADFLMEEWETVLQVLKMCEKTHKKVIKKSMYKICVDICKLNVK